MTTSLLSRLMAEGPTRARENDCKLLIESPLPFLCVSRGADRVSAFVQSEAAWVSGSSTPVVRRFVQTAAKAMLLEFGAYLILELWEQPAPEADIPDFAVVQSGAKLPETVRACLEQELQGIRPEVVFRRAKVAPPGRTQLIPAKQAARMSCSLVGIGIRPYYRDQDGQEYPLLLRRLRRSLTLALRRTFFQFAVRATPHRPAHFHALGKRAISADVWRVDKALGAIEKRFDFLLLCTPVNVESAWRKFKQSHYQKSPEWRYHPLPFDPLQLRRELLGIRVERIDDPALHRLLRAEQRDLDLRLSMLAERSSPRFCLAGQQLFGTISNALRQLALDTLDRVPPRKRDSDSRGSVDAAAFAAAAEAEIAAIAALAPTFRASVEIRSDITGVMVSRDRLLVGKALRVSPRRVKPLLYHEIHTHILTYCNGTAQPLTRLRDGLSGYDELQEGLAVFCEYLAGGLTAPRLRLLAARVLAVDAMIHGQSFLEIFAMLREQCALDARTAFIVAMRVCRGGGLAKDAVYLRGLQRVLCYLHKGGDLAPLYLGKIADTHIAIVRELQWRGILKPAMLQPPCLQTPSAQQCLLRAQSGLQPFQLLTFPSKGLLP